MTKSHPMHRKKAIHMHFRRHPKERRMFYNIINFIEHVSTSSKKKTLTK